MSGLEILGAVAASIEVVKAIRSSLIFLNDARDIPKHVSQQRDMHFRLFVQTEVFESWCESIGVSGFQYSKALESTPEYADLQQRLETDLRLANTSVAKSTLGTVVRLKDKFAEASDILQGHEPSGLTKELMTLQSEDKSKSKKKRFGIFSRSQSTIRNTSGHKEADTGSLKKIYTVTRSFQWVAVDRKAFQTLLEDITQTNNDLMTLLEQGQRKRARRQAEMAILNEIPTGPESLEKLPEDDEITTLVKMKNLQEENREGVSSSVTNKQFQPRVYRIEEFRGDIIKLGDTRSMCELNENSVFIEWKVYSKERPIRIERMLQLGNLVRLLNEKELYHKFLAPKCKGLVNDELNSRVGIVFAVSSFVDAPLQTPPRYRDLQSFIRDTSAMSAAIPPLGIRFEMARKLALAMHHLHCVQWLHKSFRSDNIVFFDDATDTEPFPVIGSTQVSREPGSQQELSDGVGELNHPTRPSTVSHAPRLQIVGWDLSRPDNPSEFSESLSNSLAGFQSQRQNMKLYSHPDVQATSEKRVRYRAQFDIYSLGLVLLEIGHWRTLDMIRKKCTSDDDFRQKLKYEWCDKLLSRMGTVYWRATQRCIFGDFEVHLSGESASSDYALQKAFQKQVVCELEKCFA